ncbi:MAG: nickel pincer cofactor biosynthesis protein LarB [Deltaproteobacteria bacterium]|nr:nickel pincer cofactor biosynthesis protein LarB [Deltaproteobacteria bacterium]
MDADTLKTLLEHIRDGRMEVEEGIRLLKDLPYMDIGHAKIDTHRELRVGYPEVIYCPGKTAEQVKAIFQAMMERGSNILATRAGEDLYAEIRGICPDAVYHREAKAVTLKKREMEASEGYIACITAGTSDIPVAEEAAVTAELFGNRVERIYDAGVAGIHRLFHNLDLIKGARVNIVVAGMDGALPSVIGGLVDKPVIAVPTSVGYGASFHGLSALLSMLNSCANGVCVVNIDNGYGAGYAAGVINRLR